MGWLALRSLRSKLVLFALLLVTVPGIVLSLLADEAARAALEQSVGRQLAQIGGDALVEIAQAIADARAEVTAWAQLDVMRDVVIGDLDKRLSRFLNTIGEGDAPYLELYAVDRAGRVVAASAPELLIAPRDLGDLASVAHDGMGRLRGPVTLGSGDAVVVEIAAPIPDPEHPGAVLGGLLVRYDWRQAINRITRIRHGLAPQQLAADVLILDDTRTIIGESWRDAASEAERTHVRGAARRLGPSVTTPHGFAVATDAHALVGWTRAPSPHGNVAMVFEPLADAFAPVTALHRRLATTLAAVLVVAVLIAVALGARMSRPLRALTRATEDILRHGEAPAHVAVRSADEIGTLATTFNAMSDALAQAQADLMTAAKFAFVGEVAAGIAHEVRTPLGIMRSSAQLLARTVPPEATESVELAHMIVGEVDRIDRVVAGLLELARPRDPRFQATDLGTVLHRALDLVDSQSREKGLEMRRELRTVAPAWCDPEQLYHVALNLIINAVQVLSAGGLVVVRTVDDSHRVGFEVEDDGPGIAPEQRQRIFTPFFSSRPGGTGLGLALVQRMVQAHGGTVTVTSDVGRGTIFRVMLEPAASHA